MKGPPKLSPPKKGRGKKRNLSVSPTLPTQKTNPNKKTNKSLSLSLNSMSEMEQEENVEALDYTNEDLDTLFDPLVVPPEACTRVSPDPHKDLNAEGSPTAVAATLKREAALETSTDVEAAMESAVDKAIKVMSHKI